MPFLVSGAGGYQLRKNDLEELTRTETFLGTELGTGEGGRERERLGGGGRETEREGGGRIEVVRK